MLLSAAVSVGAATPQDRLASERADLARRLDGLTPGKSRTCVPLTGIQEVKFYDGKGLFVQSRSRMWTNDARGGCRVSNDDMIVARLTTGQYCSGDIIETRSRSTNMFTGSCALGDFVPYSRP
ncbi:MAG: hypothetical protein ABW182_10005 [Sphingomonas sp.]